MTVTMTATTTATTTAASLGTTTRSSNASSRVRKPSRKATEATVSSLAAKKVKYNRIKRIMQQQRRWHRIKGMMQHYLQWQWHSQQRRSRHYHNPARWLRARHRQHISQTRDSPTGLTGMARVRCVRVGLFEDSALPTARTQPAT